MHSEPVIESRAAARGRRRKPGSGSVEGPVFVDNSGRRSKLLRRVGLLLGTLCVGYAFVLGMAFMGIGTSINPSSLLPFVGGPDGSAPGGGMRPQGGTLPDGTAPTGAPSLNTAPSGAPTATASASTTASAASAD